jgi:hypothetical protein
VEWCVGHEFARMVDLQWHERVSAKEKERERAREGGGGVGGKRKSERAKERESQRARERESPNSKCMCAGRSSVITATNCHAMSQFFFIATNCHTCVSIFLFFLQRRIVTLCVNFS